MAQEYYYHAIRNKKDKTLEILDSILSGGIKSVASGEIESNEIGRMNYDDEICLCKDLDSTRISRIKNLYVRNTTLFEFIYSGLLVLRIDSNIPGVYQPQVLLPDEAYRLAERGERGFTEFYDEYRTKEVIKPTSINGVLFPASILLSSPKLYSFRMNGFTAKLERVSKKDMFLGVACYFGAVQDIIRDHDLSLQIYDSSSRKPIETLADLEKIKRK